MKTINTNITDIIAKAAFEAGITNDKFETEIISSENGLLEFILTTEWNTVTCYADMANGEILGLMAVPLPMDIFESTHPYKVSSVTAAA